MVSSSVTAGEQIQLKQAPVKAAEYSSPSSEGYEAGQGKKAKKLGDCQWVRPGTILVSRSLRMSSQDSPSRGGASGSSLRR